MAEEAIRRSKSRPARTTAKGSVSPLTSWKCPNAEILETVPQATWSFFVEKGRTRRIGS